MSIFNPPAWLKEKQDRAWSQAQALGLPGKADEGWRYTSLQDFEKVRFEVRSAVESVPVSTEIRSLAAEADYVLYFRNGIFVQVESKTIQSDEVYVLPLSRVLMSSGAMNEQAKQMLGREPSPNLKALGWANFARFQEGAFVYIRSSEAKPVKVAVIHIYGGQQSGAPAMSIFPRQLFAFEVGSHADILEYHYGESDVLHVTSASDYILEGGARVNAVQMVEAGLQSYFFNDTFAALQADGDLQFTQLTLGGRLVRNEMQFRLEGAGARTRVLGLTAVGEQSHVDNSTFIHHVKGYTESEQLMKATIKDSARSVFSGRLLIEEDAQKSAAKQHCHNLLLSDKAEADARPQLEVRADDVKAAHGATVGQLREEELFYLQSRGLTASEAYGLLSQAFQNDVVGRIESAFLRQAVRDRIFRGLA